MVGVSWVLVQRSIGVDIEDVDMGEIYTPFGWTAVFPINCSSLDDRLLALMMLCIFMLFAGVIWRSLRELVVMSMIASMMWTMPTIPLFMCVIAAIVRPTASRRLTMATRHCLWMCHGVMGIAGGVWVVVWLGIFHARTPYIFFYPGMVLGGVSIVGGAYVTLVYGLALAFSTAKTREGFDTTDQRTITMIAVAMAGVWGMFFPYFNALPTGDIRFHWVRPSVLLGSLDVQSPMRVAGLLSPEEAERIEFDIPSTAVGSALGSGIRERFSKTKASLQSAVTRSVADLVP